MRLPLVQPRRPDPILSSSSIFARRALPATGPPPRASASAPGRPRSRRHQARRSRRRRTRAAQRASVRLLHCYTSPIPHHSPASSPSHSNRRKSPISRPKLHSTTLQHSPTLWPDPRSTPGASTKRSLFADVIARGARVLTRVRSRRMFKTARWRWSACAIDGWHLASSTPLNGFGQRAPDPRERDALLF